MILIGTLCGSGTFLQKLQVLFIMMIIMENHLTNEGNEYFLEIDANDNEGNIGSHSPIKFIYSTTDNPFIYYEFF